MTCRILILSAIAALTPTTPFDVNAEVPVPAGLQPGDSYHLVFNSSTFTNALSSSIDYYNDFVQAAADAAGIGASEGITWKAIASTASIDARVNASISLSTPVYNTRSTGSEKVADGFVDLWDGSIDGFPRYDEFGNENTIDAWTGSTPTGLRATNRTLGDVSGFAWCGRPTVLGPQWLTILQPSTLTQLPVYALSEELTVPDIEIDADFDADDDVDGTDFLLWQRGGGDADGNGTTHDVDLGHWQDQYGRGLNGALQTLSATAVPEPGSLLLISLVVTITAACRSVGR